jgi:hypothetical protein
MGLWLVREGGKIGSEAGGGKGLDFCFCFSTDDTRLHFFFCLLWRMRE